MRGEEGVRSQETGDRRQETGVGNQRSVIEYTIILVCTLRMLREIKNNIIKAPKERPR